MMTLYYLYICCILTSAGAAVTSQSLATGDEKFPECNVSVNNGDLVQRSPYYYIYQAALPFRPVEVTFTLPLDPLPNDYGNQSYTLYKNEVKVAQFICSEAINRPCVYRYNISSGPVINISDEKQLGVAIWSPLLIYTNGHTVCALTMWFAEKSVEIEAQLDWIEYDNDVYELIVDIQQGFPQPTVGPVLCDGVVVDGLIPTERGYLTWDPDKFRNSHCNINISNSDSHRSIPVPSLSPKSTTTATTSASTKNSAVTTIVATSPPTTPSATYEYAVPFLISLVIVLATVVVVGVIYICIIKNRKSSPHFTNNTIIQTGENHTARNDDNSNERGQSIEENTPETSSIPAHSPESHQAGSIDSGSSGFEDVMDGAGGVPHTDDDSCSHSSIVPQYPIAETGVQSTEPVASHDESSSASPIDNGFKVLDETR